MLFSVLTKHEERHNGVSTSPQNDAHDGRVKELSLVLEQRRFLCPGESTAAKPLMLILLTSTHTHTHLNEVVSRITCAEWSFEEQVESIRFLFGFNQLIVLLAVQRDVAFTVTPGILRKVTQYVETLEEYVFSVWHKVMITGGTVLYCE